MSAGDEILVRTVGLTKKFGSFAAVEDLNLNIKKGQSYGFLGPNGAGKSTTIRMLTGFMRPTAGDIYIMGKDLSMNHNVLARVGIVPDTYGFYPLLNAVEHLEFYGRLTGMDRKALSGRIPEVLETVGLDKDRWKARVGTYSHGMRQRLCIAQALIHDPELIFLDEPTTGLDPCGSYETRELIKKLNKNGMTVFVSSHILSEVEDMCTHVGIINRGHLLMEDSIENLKKMSSGRERKVIARVENMNDSIKKAIEKLRGVSGVSVYEGVNLEIEITKKADIASISAAIIGAGGELTSFYEYRPSLENIFLQLTGGDAQ